MVILENVGQLKPNVVEGILRDSLADPSLKVLDVVDPEGLGGLNDGFASDLKKIVVTVEKGGEQKKIHLVVKASLASGESWMSVLFGGFMFLKESFWYSTALFSFFFFFFLKVQHRSPRAAQACQPNPARRLDRDDAGCSPCFL